MSPKRYPIYPVIDTKTGEWICVKDCFLWAKRVAEKLNKEARQKDEQKEYPLDAGVKR